MNVFRVNEYITLKLESGRTNIYVKDKLFRQCKFLLLFIPTDDTELLDEINSIDHASQQLDFSLNPNVEYLEPEKRELIKSISPETEFWAHCSNLQTWAENDYDTRILHSNLAFPLLKALTEEGDPLARKKFKEEIAIRYSTGIKSVQRYLDKERYLKFLGREEFSSFINSGHDVIEELETLLEINLSITRLEDLHANLVLKNGEIIGVKLPRLELKEIPSCIQRLKNLEILDISINFIEVIPDWIGDLTKLRRLKSVNNKIKKLPDEIGELKSLEFLDLAVNELEGLPESFGNLIALKELRLYTNNIKSLPESIGNLKSLETISLQKNCLKDLPDSIKNLKNLRSMKLSNNPIEALPLSMLELPSLKKLSIFRTNIKKESEFLYKLQEKVQIYGYYDYQRFKLRKGPPEFWPP